MKKKLKYKILSHTADLRLEISGKIKEEVFQNAAAAMADVLKPGAKGEWSASQEIIKTESANTNTLLVDFLNEILAKSYINKAVYEVKNITLQKTNLEAELGGIKVDEFDEDIKAVTYHGAVIRKEGKLWKVRIIFDI